jgi:hypothetical protein
MRVTGSTSFFFRCAGLSVNTASHVVECGLQGMRRALKKLR